MRLKVSKSKNAASFYVTKTVYENGKEKTVTVEKLGTEAQLQEKYPGQDPYQWAKDYVAARNQEEKEGIEPPLLPSFSPNRQIAPEKKVRVQGGYLFVQSLYQALGLPGICRTISKKYKFSYDLDAILSRLLYGRILSPSSKVSTTRYAETLLEPLSLPVHQVYRALEVIAKESDTIQSRLYANSVSLSTRNDRILYYDCTNYYFEVEQEDDFRTYGVSKENRPNPLVQMGLFMDGDGIPLAFRLTPGNCNEQTTLKPLEKKLLQDFQHSRFVVCTDAGLSSTENRKFNTLGGRAFVTTQSMKKMKAYQREWALDPNGWRISGKEGIYDLEVIFSQEEFQREFQEVTFYKERWMKEGGLEQRYVVTFSLKYWQYQRQLREQQLQRAENLVRNPGKLKHPRQTDPKRFVQETRVTPEGEIAETQHFSLDVTRFEKEAKYDGFYAIATNLEDSVEEILRINHRRWEMEESFRIMKLEFKARPVYLQREDRITAHFVTCFLALTLFRYLEKRLEEKYTCREILDTLKEFQFHKVQGFGYLPSYTRTDLTDALHEQFGFRTDYEILSEKRMKEVIRSTKR